MKFGREMRKKMFAEWKDGYIDFNSLKAILKLLVPGSDSYEATRNSFFEALEANVAKTNQHFAAQEAIIAERLAALKDQFKRDPSTCSKENCFELNSLIRLLIDFGELNYRASHKILKKFLKIVGSSEENLNTYHSHVRKINDCAFNTSESVQQSLFALQKLFSNAFLDGNRSEGITFLEREWNRDWRSKPRVEKDLLSRKKAFLIDMDGVIYRGNKLIEGAKEFVDWLKAENKKFLFLSNSSVFTPIVLRQKLKRLGIDVSEDHFYTSALATAQFLASQTPEGSCYCIGSAGLFSALYDVGYTMNDVNPDYVVVGEGRDFYNYAVISKAVNLVRGGSRLIGTNCDVVDKVEEGFAPACACLMAPIELATGIKPYYLGKPNPLIVRSALQKIDSRAEQAVIIGDRMDTDVLCGLEAGMDTVLVLSGVTTPSDVNKFAFRPSIVLNGIIDVKDH